MIYLLVLGIEETAYENRKGQWTTYTVHNTPLLYDSIQDLITDEKRRVWIGTERGLYAIESDGTWKTYTVENSILSSNNIRVLAIDRSGRIWVSAGGLNILDSNGQWTTFQPDREWKSIRALAFDSQNRVWVGTSVGLVVFDKNGTETLYTKENSGLIDNSITTLAVDRFDRIWIGTHGDGVSVFDHDGHWVTYQENSQIRNDDEILTFFIDPQDQVWVGTVHGLKIISPDGVRTSNTGLQWGIAPGSLITVRSFALDKQNRMWIAIDGKLVVMDSEKNSFTTYTWDNSGLPGGVFALAIDENERLWIGTGEGLSVIDLQDQLPRTVPNNWLRLRRALRTPLVTVSMIGWLLFLPVAVKFYAFWYIALLIVIIDSIIRIRASYRIKSAKLLYRSLMILILALSGAWFILILSFGALLSRD